MKLILLILSVVTFIILAILGLAQITGVTSEQFFGILGIGLALFASSFLPMPPVA